MNDAKLLREVDEFLALDADFGPTYASSLLRHCRSAQPAEPKQARHYKGWPSNEEIDAMVDRLNAEHDELAGDECKSSYLADAANMIAEMAYAVPVGGAPGIKALHAIISPLCRANRTTEGAFDEAVNRCRTEYLACQNEANAEANFHLVLTVERLSAAPPAAEQQKTEPKNSGRYLCGCYAFTFPYCAIHGKPTTLPSPQAPLCVKCRIRLCDQGTLCHVCADSLPASVGGAAADRE